MKRQFIFHMLTIIIAISVFNTAKAESGDSTLYHRPFQLSIIYPIGTNGTDAIHYVNNFSLNLFAGVSAGVDGFEFGGIANHSKGNIDGVQIAGISNSSEGYLKGIQFSGISSYNKGKVKGWQVAGISSLNTDKVYGAQLSGISSIVTAQLQGAQISGISSVARGKVFGAQISGIVSVSSNNVHGIQLSGITNVTRGNHKGAQISGIANVASGRMDGTQIGLFNYANKLKGIQIGLINISDSVEKGVPIGLISFVRSGYHKMEIEANETFYANVTYKSGVQRFYNIYTVGYTTRNDKSIWAVGLGFGTLMHLSKKVNMNIDLIARQVNEDEWWSKELNMLNTLKINASYRVSKGMKVYGGPTFNISVSGKKDSEGNVIGDSFVPYHFFNETYNNNNNVKMYIGFNAGLRF